MACKDCKRVKGELLGGTLTDLDRKIDKAEALAWLAFFLALYASYCVSRGEKDGEADAQ